MKNNRAFVREKSSVLKKIYVLDRRGEDGKDDPEGIWCVDNNEQIKDKIANILGYNPDDILIILDGSTVNYANQKIPTHLGDVIVKLANSETHRIDLDNEGFPRTTLHCCLFPDSININKLDGEIKTFLKTLIGK